MLRLHPHAPVHAIQDDAAYFITGATYGKRPLMRDAALKQTLLDRLRLRLQEYGWALDHWVILDYHYHLMARSRRGADLSAIIRKTHSCTAPPPNATCRSG
jgi:putative transposase